MIALRQSIPAGFALALAAAAVPAAADNNFNARLTSYDETPSTLSTTGKGEFSAKLRKKEGMIEYELSYDRLESDPIMAHLHLGRSGLSGGIMVWLCGSAASPGPAGTPSCPSPGGTVSGVIGSVPGTQQVIGPGAQGVPANAFDELVDALRAGAVYVNVHSVGFPSGEIRGQLR